MNSAVKGANGERELQRILQQMGYDIQRGNTQSFGETPDLWGLPGIHIECKRREKYDIDAWMSQAVSDSERFQDGRPAVFFRKNRADWLVCMRLSDWEDLYNGRYSIEH